MMIRIDLAGLRRTKWHDYAIRFLFGGLITAAAGLIAQRWGPGIGGVFLAFPAIFPASATLVEKHETQKKNRAGLQGAMRGREAAALDAAGAALGCIGLAGFALVVWQLLAARDPNARLHATTGEVPLVRLELEQERLRPMPTPWPALIQPARSKRLSAMPSGYQYSLRSTCLWSWFDTAGTAAAGSRYDARGPERFGCIDEAPARSDPDRSLRCAHIVVQHLARHSA